MVNSPPYKTMTNTTGGPWWAEVILDRIDYHELHRADAQRAGDLASADQHTVVIDELRFLCDQFGIDAIDDQV